MKKCYYFLMVMLLVVVSVSVTACGDEDEPQDSSIVGTWQLEVADNPGANGTYGTYNVLVQFTEDGKYHEAEIFSTDFYVYYGTYSVSCDKLTVTYNYKYETETVELTYNVKGNKLTLITSYDTSTFTRVKDSAIEPYL